MLIDTKKLADKWYPKMEKLFGNEKKAKIMDVDFNNSIWKIIWDQKFKLFISFFFESGLYIFLTLIPLLVVNLINIGRVDLFVYFILVWMGFNFMPFFHIRLYALMISTAMQSVYSSAVKYFLTVDPVFHSTKSSGQIIAKVSRGSEAYEDLMDVIIFEVLKVSVSIATALVAIFIIDWKVGLTGLVSLIFVFIISTISRYFATIITTKKMIEFDDQKKEIGLESLTANQYIRSSFATNEQNFKVKQRSKKMILVLNTLWMTHISADISTRVLYILSFLVLGFMVYYQVQNQNLSLLLATGILLAYHQGTRDIWMVGRILQKYTDRKERVQDLYNFIRNFGKQTYPVLDSEKLKH